MTEIGKYNNEKFRSKRKLFFLSEDALPLHFSENLTKI